MNTMAFKRFSLRGFRSEFNIRRQVEGYGVRYICWTTLYTGKHFRRKVDEISTSIPTEFGADHARSITWDFRERLMQRHGLRFTDDGILQQ